LYKGRIIQKHFDTQTKRQKGLGKFVKNGLPRPDFGQADELEVIILD